MKKTRYARWLEELEGLHPENAARLKAEYQSWRERRFGSVKAQANFTGAIRKHEKAPEHVALIMEIQELAKAIKGKTPEQCDGDTLRRYNQLLSRLPQGVQS